MIPALIIIGILLLLWATGNIFTRVLQERFIFWGKPVSAHHNYTWPAHTEERLLAAPDGGRIHLAIFHPPPELAPKGLLLFFHGNTGNLERWKHVAHQFTRRGYITAIPDYRGYGKSTGPHSEAAFYNDALLVYDALLQEFPQQPVIVYGKSIGSAPACYVAAERPIRRLMLETPFYSMKDLFYTYYPWLPRLFGFKYPFENWKHLQRATCPVSMILAGKDLIVPYTCSRKLKALLKEKDEWIRVPEGQHNDLAMYDFYREFLERNLDQ